MSIYVGDYPCKVYLGDHPCKVYLGDDLIYPTFPTDGLISAYKFNGDLVDSQNANNLTDIGGNSVAFVSGKIATAGDFVRISDTDGAAGKGRVFNDERIGSFSVSCWINFDNLSARDGGFMGVGDATNPDSSVLIYKFTDNKIYFQYYNNAASRNSRVVTSNAVITSTGTWYHMVCTRDRSISDSWTGMSIYLNSISVTLANSGSSALSPTTIDFNGIDTSIGVRSVPSGVEDWMDGLIDQVLVYNRALTQSEIDTIYNGGSGQPLS